MTPVQRSRSVVALALRALAVVGLCSVAAAGVGCGGSSASTQHAEHRAISERAGVAGAPAGRNSVKQLRRSLDALAPKDLYIVVDTADNVLLLRRGDTTIRRAVISSGSGAALEDPVSGRRWVFETPRGVFTIQGKVREPAWVKPDWAFVEEGKTPPKRREDRVELGVLGDYALAFGNGYFIHGTLYTRMLGKNVTHGCIRVGDEDLKAIYDAARVGTQLFIL